MNQNNQVDFSEMASKWPSSHVARENISAFTGGLLKPRTCANRDSMGSGISGRIRVNRKIVYPVAEVVKWLEARAEYCDAIESEVGNDPRR